jgi:kynureninase
MNVVWAKSVALFEMFKQLMAERCPELICLSPSNQDQRGSHISFRHPNAFEICQALISAGVMGDFRAPDIIRFGLTPLYLRYADVWTAVARCADIVDSRSWDRLEFSNRKKVT